MSVVVRECTVGKGLFATQAFQAQDVLWSLQGDPRSTPTRTTICIGPDQHVDDPLGIYFNHSFEPNCRIEGRSVIALRTIAQDEHLTFNYVDNEPTIAAPFQVEDGRWVK